MSGKTILFGWFGLPSFIVTPFVLLINLFRYLGAWELRKSSDYLSGIAVGWKALSVAAIGVIISILYFIYTPQPSSMPFPNSATTVANRSFFPTSTFAQAVISARTATARPRPTPTQPVCHLWNEIVKSDVGRNLCVQGYVKKAYWGGDIFYMSFSDEPDAFRLIVLAGYYFDDVQGQCVMVDGVVKAYGDMPYIEVGENLWPCK